MNLACSSAGTGEATRSGERNRLIRICEAGLSCHWKLEIVQKRLGWKTWPTSSTGGWTFQSIWKILQSSTERSFPQGSVHEMWYCLLNPKSWSLLTLSSSPLAQRTRVNSWMHHCRVRCCEASQVSLRGTGNPYDYPLSWAKNLVEPRK